MWAVFLLGLLVGATASKDQDVWKMRIKYDYLVESRSFTGLEQTHNQYSGIICKYRLTALLRNASTVSFQLWDYQCASIQSNFSNGWEGPLPTNPQPQWEKVDIGNEPFEAVYQDGVIERMIVESTVPTWEVNLKRGVVSCFQIDSRGTGLIRRDDNEKPEGISATYNVMETSVLGRYETVYDMAPQPRYISLREPLLEKFLSLDGDGIQIGKSINFTDPSKMVAYNYGFDAARNWEPVENRMGDTTSHLVETEVLGVGYQDNYTVLYAKVVQKLSTAPFFYQEQSGVIGSFLRAILVKLAPSYGIPPQLKSPVAVGLEYQPLVIPEPRKEKRGLSFGGRVDLDLGKHFAGKEEGHGRKPHYVRPRSERNNDDYSEEDFHEKRERQTRSIAMKKLKKQALSAEDSSSSSSSSESDEDFEPLSFHYDKPFLPPFSPYGVYFSGNTKDTKNLQLYNWIVVEFRRIAEELQDPGRIPFRGTLARISNAVQVMRSSHHTELRQAADKLYYEAPQNPSEREEIFYTSWTTFVDSLALAGSPASFKLVNDLVKERKIYGHRGGLALALAAHHIRVPSDEYLETMWETVQDESLDFKVRRNAIMAFGDMIRNLLVDIRTTHNHFPVHVYGNLTVETEDMLQKYIKYYDNKLSIAVATGFVNVTLYWIRGLGNMGHADILSVLRPYIDGTKDVTNLQRFIAVKSLDYMAIINPKISIPFLHSLYESLGNTHDVRCEAVNLLSELHLPNSLMQSMAVFTNSDVNNEVNAAVKTLLESKASLKAPEYKEIARGAQAAITLLNPKTYSTHFSMSKHYSNIVKRTGLSYDLIVNMIGSEDSILHQGVELRLAKRYGGLRTVVSKFFGVVSSQSVLRYFAKNRFIPTRPIDVEREDPRNHFKVKVGIPEELETVLNLKTAHFTNLMLVENNCTLESSIRVIKKQLQYLKSGRAYNFTQVVNVAPVTVGVPSVLGMPVRFSYNEPSIISAKAKAIVTTYPDSSRDPSSKVFYIPDRVNVAMKTQLLYSRSKLAVSQIIVPFNGKIYTSGLQSTMQVNLPLSVSAKWNIANNTFNTTFAPIRGDRDFAIAHVSSIPYTTIQEIWSLTPPELTPKLQIVHVRQPRWTNTTYGSNSTGMAFRVEYKSEIQFQDRLWREERNERFDNIARIIFPQAQTTIYHYNVTLFYEKNSPASNASFEVAYGSEQLGEKHSKSPSRRPRSLRRSSRRGHGQDDFEESDAEVSNTEEIRNGTKTWINLKVDFQPKGGDYSLNASVVSSHISPIKQARLEYISRDIRQKNPENTTLAMTIYEEPIPGINYKHVLHSNHNATVLMTYNSSHGFVDAKVKLQQSYRYLQKVINSGLGRLCEQQMVGENLVLHACRNATAEAMFRDKYEVEGRYSLSEELRNKTRQLLREVVHILHENADINAVNVSNTNKTFNASLWFSPTWKTLNASISLPNYAVQFSNVRTDPYVSRVVASHQSYGIYQRWQGFRTNGKDMPTCAVDNKYVTTFDNSTYSATLSSCWVVLLTTAYTAPISDCEEQFEQLTKQQRNVTILAANRGNRVIRMMVGNQKIEMEGVRLIPNRVIVKVNGKSIPLNRNNITQVNGTDHQILLLAYPQNDGTVVVTFPREELVVQFNGNQVLLRASNNQRSSVRGLCGTLDGEWVTDFTTKDNCLLGDPRLFVASYVDTNVAVCEDKEVLQAIEEYKRTTCLEKRVIRSASLGVHSTNDNYETLKESGRRGESSDSSDSSDSSTSSDSSESSQNSDNSNSSDSSSSSDGDSKGKNGNSDSSSSDSSTSESSESNDENGSSSSSSSSEEQEQNNQRHPNPQQRQEESKDRKKFLHPGIFVDVLTRLGV